MRVATGGSISRPKVIVTECKTEPRKIAETEVTKPSEFIPHVTSAGTKIPILITELKTPTITELVAGKKKEIKIKESK